jgi:hypothetical protein
VVVRLPSVEEALAYLEVDQEEIHEVGLPFVDRPSGDLQGPSAEGGTLDGEGRSCFVGVLPSGEEVHPWEVDHVGVGRPLEDHRP